MKKGLVALLTALALAGCNTTSEKPNVTNITNNYYTTQSASPIASIPQTLTIPQTHSFSQPIVTATIGPLQPLCYQSQLAEYIQCAAQMIGENAGCDYQSTVAYLENRFNVNLNNFQNAESLSRELIRKNDGSKEFAGFTLGFQRCSGVNHGSYTPDYLDNQLNRLGYPINNRFSRTLVPSSSGLVGFGNRTEAEVERSNEFFRQRNAFNQYQTERDSYFYQQQIERDFFRDQQRRTLRRFGR